MVMPRSSSRALESIDTPSSATPAWRSKASVRVVFPWSTCAIIAMFLISIIKKAGEPRDTDTIRRKSLFSKRALQKIFNQRFAEERAYEADSHKEERGVEEPPAEDNAAEIIN